MEINTDDLINEDKQLHEKPKMHKKIKMPKTMNLPRSLEEVQQMHTEHVIHEQQNDKLDDTETKSNLKKLVFKTMAFPMFKYPNKHERLQKNLENSKFMNQYVDKNLHTKIMKYLDDDLKALATYGYYLIDAIQQPNAQNIQNMPQGETIPPTQPLSGTV